MARRIALLIGNSEFVHKETLPDLRGPTNDVLRLRDILGDPSVGAFSVTTFLNWSSFDLLFKLDTTLQQAERNDLVLIYYSGHGKLNLRGQLCLAARNTNSDALQTTSLPLTQIKELVDNTPCRNVILLLDCCFSGAVGRAMIRGAVEDQLRASVAQTAGFHILTSSTAIQASFEDQEEDGEVLGAFTRCVVEGLRSGDADVDGDGAVTVSNLRQYVQQRLVSQRPKYWGVDSEVDPVIAYNIALQRQNDEQKQRLRSAQGLLASWFREGAIPTHVYSSFLTWMDEDPSGTPPPISRTQILELLESERISPKQVITTWEHLHSYSSHTVPVSHGFEPKQDLDDHQYRPISGSQQRQSVFELQQHQGHQVLGGTALVESPAAKQQPDRRVQNTIVALVLLLFMLAVAFKSGMIELPRNTNTPLRDGSQDTALAETVIETIPTSTSRRPIVYDVQMITTADGASGRFEPDSVIVHRGDIVRFRTDGVSVHNVSFPSNENPGAGNLPPSPGPYLTYAGQTYDIAIGMDPGVYRFQCDPHAPTGMKGKVYVQGDPM
ncbi:MAG TPA: caspase family protein [Longimicrobium sp.]